MRFVASFLASMALSLLAHHVVAEVVTADDIALFRERFTNTSDELAIKFPRRGLEARANGLVFTFTSFPFEKGTTINAYIWGQKSDMTYGFVTPTGQWYPASSTTADGQTPVSPQAITIPVPISQNTNVTLPFDISSAQVVYALNNTLTFVVKNVKGVLKISPPSATAKADKSYNAFWGFSEFTWANGVLNINPTAVAFAGLPNTFAVYNSSGKAQGFGNGLEVGAVHAICNSLQQQSNSDGQPWGNMCIYNNKNQLVRVLSPDSYRSPDFGGTGAFSGYYEPYVNQVWSRYSSQSLNLGVANTPSQATCQVSNNQLQCTGAIKGSFAKPSTGEIFGCSGATLGNNSPLCAGFIRSTLLNNSTTPCGPVSSFYQSPPTDYYSKFAHANSFSGIGYAFPYDDSFSPDTADPSGLLHITNPAQVLHIIGGFGWGGYTSGEYSN